MQKQEKVRLKENKCNEENFIKITDLMLELFKEKNRRYGDSLEVQYDEFGILSTLIRITDKVNRLKYLIQNEKDFGDEKLEDTLIDLANYVVMTLMCVRGDKEDGSF